MNPELAGEIEKCLAAKDQRIAALEAKVARYRAQDQELSAALAHLQGFVIGELGDTITAKAESKIDRLMTDLAAREALIEQLREVVERLQAHDEEITARAFKEAWLHCESAYKALTPPKNIEAYWLASETRRSTLGEEGKL